MPSQVGGGSQAWIEESFGLLLGMKEGKQGKEKTE